MFWFRLGGNRYGSSRFGGGSGNSFIDTDAAQRIRVNQFHFIPE
jgi:hypothetical protein